MSSLWYEIRAWAAYQLLYGAMKIAPGTHKAVIASALSHLIVQP